jgi:hypothetical protein
MTLNETLANDCIAAYVALCDVSARLASRGLMEVEPCNVVLDELTTAAVGLVGPTRAIELGFQRGLDLRPLLLDGDD